MEGLEDDHYINVTSRYSSTDTGAGATNVFVAISNESSEDEKTSICIEDLAFHLINSESAATERNNIDLSVFFLVYPLIECTSVVLEPSEVFTAGFRTLLREPTVSFTSAEERKKAREFFALHSDKMLYSRLSITYSICSHSHSCSSSSLDEQTSLIGRHFMSHIVNWKFSLPPPKDILITTIEEHLPLNTLLHTSFPVKLRVTNASDSVRRVSVLSGSYNSDIVPRSLPEE